MAGDSRYTPLVGVIGEGEEDRPPHPQREALTQLLLERGADPFDMQVIYNTHFHGDVLWFLELTHAHSMTSGRQAAWEDPNWSMFDMGGYGCGARFLLHQAVSKSDVRLAEWMLAHGASPNAPPPRAATLPQGSLHEEALRTGSTEMSDLLLRFGATPGRLVLTDEEVFQAACLRLDRDEVRAHARTTPGVPAVTGGDVRGRHGAIARTLSPSCWTSEYRSKSRIATRTARCTRRRPTTRCGWRRS